MEDFTVLVDYTVRKFYIQYVSKRWYRKRQWSYLKAARFPLSAVTANLQEGEPTSSREPVDETQDRKAPRLVLC